ncbi:hypothetical protein EY643_14110 [Halioglobus maricola]|uniref:Sulfotransferase family protein n=1 Tax=Halioglobus maricola TaxID=2601894 RepID=A0A5P9NMG0_9GAMM|nr:hypothetical protein [Halioglobus maricola]QFU76696.1 hypothetical protein EY643_14110 [Halioglobus maricola]
MKRLVIHAGMAKTGTTTIQDSLGKACEALKSDAVYYPDWRPYNHSYELAALFRGDSKAGYYYRQFGAETDEEWEAERERLRLQWRAFFDSFTEGTAIISAEGLEQFFAEDVEALLEFARPSFDRCMAVIYVRHPLTSIKSRWEQAVKQLDEPRSGEDLLQECKRRTRFGAVRRWSKAVGEGNLVVRPFDPQHFQGGDLVEDFLHSIGLESLTLTGEVEAASNTSIGHNGTAFLIQFNGQYPQYRDGKYNADRGMASNLEVLYRLMRETADETLVLDVKFSADEAAAINREITFVNRFLSEAARFAPVEASAGKSHLPDPDKLPPAYVADIANGLLQLLEREKADRRHLGREVKRLQEEGVELRARLEELSPSDNDEDQ